MQRTNSERLFAEAQFSIPGGVNSPVRAFRSVGGTPVFMERALGAYLHDADGNSYIDYINSWGPMILGHSFAPVVAAIQAQAAVATSFGAPTALETAMAELIRSMAPGIDLIRMVSSGTEACMSALRLARGYTGRNKLIKFDGCYHGHADPFLVKAGSGVATFNIQEVPGIPQAVSSDTLVAPYNNLEAVEELVKANPEQVAAIIIEPVAGNMGCIPPLAGYADSLDPRLSDMLERVLRCAIVGGPAAIAEGLSSFIAHHKPDEIMVTAQVFDAEARRRSYEILSRIHPPAGA